MRFLIRSIVICALFTVFSFCNSSKARASKKVVSKSETIVGTPATVVADSTGTFQSGTIQSLVTFANKHLHIPYRSGGSSKRGFDCSGFVRYCFNKLDISLPHSSAAQAKHGETVALDEAKPGDLIFFKGESSKSSRIGHVGIITEVAPGYVKFIHSAWKGGIRYDLLNASYYHKRFVAVKRLVSN